LKIGGNNLRRELLKKSVYLLVMFLVSVSLLVSCAGSPSSTSSSASTLKVAIASEPDSTDPTISKYQANNQVVFNNIYDVLVNLDWETGKPSPGIAT